MPHRIRSEAELGTFGLLPAGTLVELLRPDGTTWQYHAVGSTTPAIAARLGWPEGNVWLRGPERAYMLREHPELCADLDRAIAYVL